MKDLKLFGLTISHNKPEQEDPMPFATIWAAINDIAKEWYVKDDRRAVSNDIRRMVGGDEYAAEALDILVGDCFKVMSFYDPIIDVECKDDKIREMVQDILKRAQFVTQAKNILYNLLQHGEAFCEMTYYPNNKFARYFHIPASWSMYRNVNKHGQLKDGDPKTKRVNACAYDQRSDVGEFLAGFYPYQIIHYRIPPWTAEGYGTAFLKACRKNWLRLQFLEDTMAVARALRAYLKMVHKVPVPDDADNKEIKKHIKAYKKELTTKNMDVLAEAVLKRRRMPSSYTVNTDFFLPQNITMKGDVTAIDPQNTQLTNITDIKYFLDRFFGRLKVQKARLANEKDVRAKATMSEINTAYAATIVAYQIDFLGPTVDMVNRALFFEGIDIDRIDPFKLIMPSPFIKGELDRAKIDAFDATTGSKYITTDTISRDTIRKQNFNMDEKESNEEEIKIQHERELFPKGAIGMVSSTQAHPDDDVMNSLARLKRSLEKDNGDHYKKNNRIFVI